jgi:cell division protein FtsZ
MTSKPTLIPVHDMKPKLTVIGVGGAGCNAINNMMAAGLTDVDFVAANTDSQSLAASSAEFRLQLGAKLTEGLGAGSKPEIGEAAAEEAIEDIRKVVAGSHMVFVAAGMGGGTGTGAAAVIARTARDMGILTVGVVTRPFQFEGLRRQRLADEGIKRLRENVDTLIVIPNQNLFRIANDKTTFAEAFILADQVLYSGVACIVDLIVKDGLINLDFADVRTIMTGMGSAMMGTGEAEGPGRATVAAEEAISNPLLEDVTLSGAKGLLLSITGDRTLTLYEVDEAANRVRQEVDPDAVIIVGATFDEALGSKVRVSIVASGMARNTAAGAGSPAAAVATPSSAPVTPPPLPHQSYATPPQSAPDMTDLANSPPPRPDAKAMAWPGSAPTHSGGPPAYPTPFEPPAPAPQTWMAPGNVMIEEAAPLRRAPFSVQPDSGYSSSPSDFVAPPPFTPMPPVDVRGPNRRLPEVSDFPAIGQREYHAKKSGWPDQGPPRVLSEPRARATEPADRKSGWFQRFAGRLSGASDSQASERNKTTSEQANFTPVNPNADDQSGRRASSQSPAEHVELPVFFRGGRRG